MRIRIYNEKRLCEGLEDKNLFRNIYIYNIYIFQYENKILERCQTDQQTHNDSWSES